MTKLHKIYNKIQKSP